MTKADFKFKLLLLFIILIGSVAHATEVKYATDSPKGADEWIYITENGQAADEWWIITENINAADLVLTSKADKNLKWIYFTDSPKSADRWVIITNTGKAADKWVFIEDESLKRYILDHK